MRGGAVRACGAAADGGAFYLEYLWQARGTTELDQTGVVSFCPIHMAIIMESSPFFWGILVAQLKAKAYALKIVRRLAMVALYTYEKITQHQRDFLRLFS